MRMRIYFSLNIILRKKEPISEFLFTYLVGLIGLEPATSPLSGARSNQLSYRPNCFLTAL